MIQVTYSVTNNFKAKMLKISRLWSWLHISAIGNEGGLGNVSTIIVWDRHFDIDSVSKTSKIPKSLRVIPWNVFMDEFGSRDKERYDSMISERIQSIKPGHCCTLIYTSGTTGTPKGVMLSHDNLIWSIGSVLMSQKSLSFWGPQSVPRHTLISYLPLSHIAAQMLDIYGPLCIGYHGGDGTIYFARNDALKGSLIKTLTAVEPTVFLGVPRVWEKIEEKMRLIGKKGFVLWCFGKCWECFRNFQHFCEICGILGNHLVFHLLTYLLTCLLSYLLTKLDLLQFLQNVIIFGKSSSFGGNY